MTKRFILWSHPRSASSQFLEIYAKDFNLRVNLEEPIKQGSAKMEDLLKLKMSFKIMGYHATREIIGQTIDADYNHIILFRKDIYRTYLSFIFSCYTGIWHKHQLDNGEKGDTDIIKGIVKARLLDIETKIADVKRFYKDLDRVYLHLVKNNVQYKIIETQQAIDYLGPFGFQGTDKHYYNLQNAQAKEELESFIQTLEIYKNHDMQSTI